MRNPAGTGLCWPMISLTLATALEVRVMGGAAFLVTSGTVVVAIRISLALKLIDYIRCNFSPEQNHFAQHPFDADFGLKVAGRKGHPAFRNQFDFLAPGLRNGAIIIPLGPPHGSARVGSQPGGG